MRNALFESTGAHVLVDGQYGSTGKGVLAAWLAARNIEYDNDRWDGVVSNAGPNSGHTFYHGDEKHVLKQLPTFAVASYLLGVTIPVFLSAGAVIDTDILIAEAKRYPGIPIFVHPNAAVITQADRDSEVSAAGSIAAVAGTRSGTGMAIARKVMRDPTATFGWYWRNAIHLEWPRNVQEYTVSWLPLYNKRYFVEVSQGFSLGINQRFYPKCTSRECTVAQAIADAGMPPRYVRKTYMSLRTWPIRVGNVDGHSSGEWYPDQIETTWDALGVEPELTTVTQRVRRVASFSAQQFRDAVWANDPDLVFLNFMNYPESREVLKYVQAAAKSVTRPYDVITGWGPKSEDVHIER